MLDGCADPMSPCALALSKNLVDIALLAAKQTLRYPLLQSTTKNLHRMQAPIYRRILLYHQNCVAAVISIVKVSEPSQHTPSTSSAFPGWLCDVLTEDGICQSCKLRSAWLQDYLADVRAKLSTAPGKRDVTSPEFTHRHALQIRCNNSASPFIVHQSSTSTTCRTAMHVRFPLLVKTLREKIDKAIDNVALDLR
ncbi:hypothetical protein HGRIS_000769 [Hohenbuehelia grisea]|uniref:Uncharacterized protein n=1 Tax=Hohenbuehelia grisea TaxID=104357 RepID=A0ABR3IPP7_9AGAR